MNNTFRPKSTHLNHRSFFVDKRSTISTRQTSRSPAKSFIMKSSHPNLSKNTSNINEMVQSTPIQIYFNPQYRTNYVKKVIDTFFVNFSNENKKNKIQINKKAENLHIFSLRSRMKEWKKKNKIVEEFGYFNTGKFIRSSPQKQILSDLSQQKSLAIIDQTNLSKFQSNQENQVDQISLMNLDQILIKEQKKSRPYSEQNKKRKLKIQLEENLSPFSQIPSSTISVFFNQSNSPRQKLKKQVRKIITSNEYFQECNVYEQKKLSHKIRKYTGGQNPLWQRQEKIRKKGIKSLWQYTKWDRVLKYPLEKSIKNMISQQFKYGQTELDSYLEIYPKPYYYQLFENKNQQLIDIIISKAKFILNNQGKILTFGALNLKNLYRNDQKSFFLKDLGSSAILQQIKIRDRNIKHLYPPILRQNDEKGNWIVRPEYLAPECIDTYYNTEYRWIQNQPQSVMAAQIWSLGCMILQLITLIPIHSDIRCRIKSSQNNLRKGYLSIKFDGKNLDVDLLKRKQKNMPTVLNKIIKNQLKNVPVEGKIIQSLKQMLAYESKQRITPQQLIQLVKY